MIESPFQRLQQAVVRAWQMSDLHRNHWLAHGVPEGWVPKAPEELPGLPTIEKEDVLKAEQGDPPWGGNLCVPQDEIAQLHLTSGTTGIGQEAYALTAADVDVMGRSWGWQFAQIGLERGDAAVFTIPVSFLCAGLSALEGARLHGLVPIVTGLASKQLILEFLVLHRAAYLYGTESFLMQLAAVAEAEGMDGRIRGHLKGVQAVGASPLLTARIDEVFGAKLFEVYGCTQAAAKIATTCRLSVDGGTVHFDDTYLFTELRHPETDEPVDEGPANVVLSTTYRQATPLLRFHLRDQVDVVPAGACACGDPRPGLRPGSVRRTDAMMKVRGMNVWPDTIERVVLAQIGVRDYRGVVRRRADGADELVVRVAAPEIDDRAALERRLVEEIRAAALVRPVVEFDDDLPASDGIYKPRRWTDERTDFERTS